MSKAGLKRFGIVLVVVVALLFAVTVLLMYVGAKEAAVLFFDVTFVVALLGSAVWTGMAIREKVRSKRS